MKGIVLWHITLFLRCTTFKINKTKSTGIAPTLAMYYRVEEWKRRWSIRPTIGESPSRWESRCRGKPQVFKRKDVRPSRHQIRNIPSLLISVLGSRKVCKTVHLVIKGVFMSHPPTSGRGNWIRYLIAQLIDTIKRLRASFYSTFHYSCVARLLKSTKPNRQG